MDHSQLSRTRARAGQGRGGGRGSLGRLIGTCAQRQMWGRDVGGLGGKGLTTPRPAFVWVLDCDTLIVLYNIKAAYIAKPSS